MRISASLSPSRSDSSCTERALDLPQLGIAPGIGAEKHHQLVAGIEHDVPGLGGHLPVLPGKALGQVSHLLKAAVPACVYYNLFGFGIGGEFLHRLVLLPGYLHRLSVDGEGELLLCHVTFLQIR